MISMRYDDFWMKTVNTEKALESYISEILETLEKD